MDINVNDVEIKKKIKTLIIEVLDRELNIDDDTDLADEGLDSISTVELILLLEEELKLEVDDSDLIIENFITVNHIVKLLQHYNEKL
ncbi:phosphopantetheine-binding protein [Priestia koreensis]|uniref:phosphopantetheine-binding protein n=1 Tax=Priestia koreensis TaxID=284581 RepID=UPI001F58E62B|nr:phosphopantetheine-binding protein [Priestia koreensis]UNL87593.1 acyl carrier protein [Priestia koreensis]